MGIELDRFRFQEGVLVGFAAEAGTKTNGAARIHDAVPRHVVRFRKRVQRVADLPGTGCPREIGDLSVGGDASARDAPHHAVDSLVRARRSRQR